MECLAYVGQDHGEHLETPCEILGKLEVGFQTRKDLTLAQLDAAEVWKGNWEVITS